MGWRRSLTIVAIGQAGALAAVGVAVRDREAVAIAAATVGGAALLRVRRGLFGDVVLGLLFLDVVGWLAPAAVDNIVHHDSLAAVAVPVVLGSIAIAGLPATIGHARERRGHRSGRGPALALLAPTVLGGAAMVTALVVGVGRAESLPAGAIPVSTRNAAFSSEVLRAREGTVTVAVTNHDLFWHTFTVDRLDVDLRVPVGAHRQATFAAPPGTYVYYCAVPGHRSAGMEGTLVVGGP